jgi:ubiquinone/menaquinone biosynthesis C-methylase UbiE
MGDSMNDPEGLERQYGTQDRLLTRSEFWAPSPPAESPQDIALEALRTSRAGHILEIGCGRGQFAARMQHELGAHVLATDRAEAMVEATRLLGVDAEIVDADHLPYIDDRFDAVVALWMLYHVPHLDRTLAEVRRVLKPGGVFVAVTNSSQHTADLRAAVGLGPALTQFMAEDGADTLRRHFDQVESTPTSSKAVADHATAKAYLETFVPELAWRLEPYDGLRTYKGSSAVFVAQ